ncbi:hypothetical protein NDU88_004819 [Pleurodeles waltl]|uniref:Uncharacterized protein n=1 Tax=Pleurodeles waltl TaxID=8319 RepID=A0AAV7LKY5_PLEWA|nr:hypothetical protein NDU88_004819 [Pleurodeles waltl]
MTQCPLLSWDNGAVIFCVAQLRPSSSLGGFPSSLFVACRQRSSDLLGRFDSRLLLASIEPGRQALVAIDCFALVAGCRRPPEESGGWRRFADGPLVL